MVTKDYMSFLSSCKTERECVQYFEKELKNKKFIELKDGEKVCPKGHVYVTKMGKALAAFKIGDEPISKGMNILCAHIDSPRLDIKMNPVFSDSGITYLNTHYYGGIRKYQWVARPLALHGVVCKKDGTTVTINIGEKKDDPVFYISDLLPHLAQDQGAKKASEFITGEELDIIIGNDSNPLKPYSSDKDAKAEEPILYLLKQKYNIEKEDFYSAELEVVPAGEARYVGIDENLIVGYGHDDRSCAFTSFEAFLDESNSKRTTCVLLVDKEEIGSVGATGMDSLLFENIVYDLVHALSGTDYDARKCLQNSNILSSDVNAAFDPHHADVFDKDNTCYLGKGPAFCKFTGARGKSGANDANPEYIVKLRNALDSRKLPYQMSELGKVDKGGGGTIALFAARYGMNTIDVGIPVLSMHAPCELIDRHDLDNTYALYRTFLKDLD